MAPEEARRPASLSLDVASRPVDPVWGELTATELSAFRFALAAGGLINLAMWFLLRGEPGRAAADTPAGRLFISGWCFAQAILPSYSTWLRRYFVFPLYAALFLFTLRSGLVLTSLNVSPFQVIGFLIMFVAAGLGFIHPLHHLVYLLLAIPTVGLMCLTTPHPQTSPALVMTALTGIGLMMHIMLRLRLRQFERLSASEELRRLLVERTTDAFLLIDPGTRRIVDCNARARTLFQLPPVDTSGEFAAAVFGCPTMGAIETVMVHREISERGEYRREHAYVLPDGSALWGDLAVTSLVAGRRRYWLARIADVSDRHATTGDRRRPLREGAADPEGAPDLLGRFTEEGLCLSVSASSLPLTGFPAHQVIGMSIYDAIHPEDVEIVRAAHLGAYGPQFSVRFRLKRKDGTWLPMEGNGRRFEVPGADGRMVHEVIVVARDISDRLRLEAAARREGGAA